MPFDWQQQFTGSWVCHVDYRLSLYVGSLDGIDFDAVDRPTGETLFRAQHFRDSGEGKRFAEEWARAYLRKQAEVQPA